MTEVTDVATTLDLWACAGAGLIEGVLRRAERQGRMSGYWAAQADRVLAGVFAALPRNASDEDVRRACRAAYPFGERAYWPYKVWLARCRAWRDSWRKTIDAKLNPDQP